jgi:DNA-binding NarL/FixJ family response regulator
VKSLANCNVCASNPSILVVASQSKKSDIRKQLPGTKQPNPIRVLIADDHQVVREGLRAMIDRQPDMKVIEEACNGREAVVQFRLHHPDIIVMDVRMPQVDGIAAARIMRENNPEARIILLSSYADDEHVYQGLRTGAKGYVLKDALGEELLDTIRKVHKGMTYISPPIAAKLADRVTRSELSGREIEVLRLMVTGKSNKEIGTALYIEEGTVKVHVSRLLKKLHATSRTEAINLALMHGIVEL